VKPSLSGAAGALMQKAAVVFLVLLCSVILHKGYVDISGLAYKHSGQQFWVALARYFIGNLGGGGKRAEAE